RGFNNGIYFCNETVGEFGDLVEDNIFYGHLPRNFDWDSFDKEYTKRLDLELRDNIGINTAKKKVEYNEEIKKGESEFGSFRCSNFNNCETESQDKNDFYECKECDEDSEICIFCRLCDGCNKNAVEADEGEGEICGGCVEAKKTEGDFEEKEREINPAELRRKINQINNIKKQQKALQQKLETTEEQLDNFLEWFSDQRDICYIGLLECKKCGKDKEIGWVFSKYCERCEKNGVDKNKEKEKKRNLQILQLSHYKNKSR
ncbi:10840_t:CDS:2, partial [Racocetra persica]